MFLCREYQLTKEIYMYFQDYIMLYVHQATFINQVGLHIKGVTTLCLYFLR